MKLIQLIALALVLIPLISACSGRQGNRISGKACPRGEYDPYPHNKEVFSEPRFELRNLKEDVAFPEGTFIAEQAHLIYHDTVDNVKVHVKETKTKKFTNEKPDYKQTVVCVKGFRRGMEVSAQSNVITGISVNPGADIALDFKEFGFSKANRLQAKIDQASRKINETPKGFIDQFYPESEMVLIKHKDVKDKNISYYDLRGESREDNGKIIFRYFVRLKFLPAPDAEDVEEEQPEEETPQEEITTT